MSDPLHPECFSSNLLKSKGKWVNCRLPERGSSHSEFTQEKALVLGCSFQTSPLTSGPFKVHNQNKWTVNFIVKWQYFRFLNNLQRAAQSGQIYPRRKLCFGASCSSLPLWCLRSIFPWWHDGNTHFPHQNEVFKLKSRPTEWGAGLHRATPGKCPVPWLHLTPFPPDSLVPPQSRSKVEQSKRPVSFSVWHNITVSSQRLNPLVWPRGFLRSDGFEKATSSF